MAFEVKTQTLGKVPGELFFGEWDHRYTRESGTIENDGTTAGTSPDITLGRGELIGIPLKKASGQWQFASAADLATPGSTVFGFLISGQPITELAADEITGSEYAILVQGPAFMNESEIPANDAYGDAIDAADYIAAARALPVPVKTLPSPETTVTQTT